MDTRNNSPGGAETEFSLDDLQQAMESIPGNPVGMGTESLEADFDEMGAQKFLE